MERYTGPWNAKLSNTILVVGKPYSDFVCKILFLSGLSGNEADPATPFRSAKLVADQLGDSAILVEQDDYGHSTLAMHSDW